MANITKESEHKEAKIPKKSDKGYIALTLKQEFGEDITYNKTENTIYILDNRHFQNPILIKLLSEYKCYVQSSLF